MAKRKPGGPQAALTRTVRILSALLGGEALDARRAAVVSGLNVAAANTQLKTLQKLPGVIVEKKLGRKVWRYAALPSTWGPALVVAASFGTSLATLFSGSAYRNRLEEVRARLVNGTSRPDQFRNVERKFWFHCQGGDVALDEAKPLLDVVINALVDGNMLGLRYADSTGAQSEMTVAPLSLVLYQHQLYLLARRESGKLHPYRLSRILTARPQERFEYPAREQFDPETVFADSFGIWLGDGDPVEITVRIDGVWATYALRHRWHKSQTVTRDGAAVVVKIRCRVCREVEQWVLGLGESAEVLGPPELKERLRERLQQLSARYLP